MEGFEPLPDVEGDQSYAHVDPFGQAIPYNPEENKMIARYMAASPGGGSVSLGGIFEVRWGSMAYSGRMPLGRLAMLQVNTTNQNTREVVQKPTAGLSAMPVGLSNADACKELSESLGALLAGVGALLMMVLQGAGAKLAAVAAFVSQEQVRNTLLIVGAVGVTSYGIHALWFHNYLHWIGKFVVVILSVLLLVGPLREGVELKLVKAAFFERRDATSIGLVVDHAVLTYSCLADVPDMMLFMGVVHFIIAIRCNDLPDEIPRWIWWLFAAVLLIDGLDGGFKAPGVVHWRFNELSTLAQPGVHMVGKLLILAALLSVYVPATVIWLARGFPRDLRTLVFLSRNLMVMYACIFDLPDMQLMAGITYITIAAVAKTTWSQPMQPIQNFKQFVADYEKGSDGASSTWALFGAILFIDGLTAPVAPP